MNVSKTVSIVPSTYLFDPQKGRSPKSKYVFYVLGLGLGSISAWIYTLIYVKFLDDDADRRRLWLS